MSQPGKAWWRYKRVWIIAGAGWLFAITNCVAFAVVATSVGNDLSTLETPVDEGPQSATTCGEAFGWQLLAVESGDARMLAEATDRWEQLDCESALAPTSTRIPTATDPVPTLTPISSTNHRLNSQEVLALFREYAKQADGEGLALFSCWVQATGQNDLFTTKSVVDARPDSPGVWVVTATVESSLTSPVTRTWIFRESTGLFVGPC